MENLSSSLTFVCGETDGLSDVKDENGYQVNISIICGNRTSVTSTTAATTVLLTTTIAATKTSISKTKAFSPVMVTPHAAIELEFEV